MILGLDALASLGSTYPITSLAVIPRLDSTSNDTADDWLDFSNSSIDGDLTSFASTPWVGNGTTTTPYNLAFDGTASNYVLADLTSIGSGNTDFTVGFWIKPDTLSNGPGCHRRLERFLFRGPGRWHGFL